MSPGALPPDDDETLPDNDEDDDGRPDEDPAPPADDDAVRLLVAELLVAELLIAELPEDETWFGAEVGAPVDDDENVELEVVAAVDDEPPVDVDIVPLEVMAVDAAALEVSPPLEELTELLTAPAEEELFATGGPASGLVLVEVQASVRTRKRHGMRRKSMTARPRERPTKTSCRGCPARYCFSSLTLKGGDSIFSIFGIGDAPAWSR